MFIHQANIKKPIVAFCSSVILEKAPQKLRITYDNLNRICSYPAPLEIQMYAKALVSWPEPQTHKYIAKDAPAFQRFSFDRPCNLSIKTNSRHQQKIPILPTTQINSPRLTMHQHIACPIYVQRNTHFACPHIDCTRRKHTECRLTPCQFLDNLINRPISSRCNYQVRPLLNCIMCELSCMTGSFRQPQFSLPPLSPKKCERLI